MNKTHKKIHNTLRDSLTQVCDTALDNVAGFKWLTHLINYDNFPHSLNVVCIFDTHENQLLAQQNRHNYLCDLIQRALLKENIKLGKMAGHVTFDNEEHCQANHAGNWARRLG
jgi:hypothetical protein